MPFAVQKLSLQIYRPENQLEAIITTEKQTSQRNRAKNFVSIIARDLNSISLSLLTYYYWKYPCQTAAILNIGYRHVTLSVFRRKGSACRSADGIDGSYAMLNLLLGELRFPRNSWDFLLKN